MTQRKKLVLYLIYSLSFCAAAAFFIAARLINNTAFFYAAVSIFTTFFHCTIRIAFANLIFILIARFCTSDRWWFCEKPFERRFYKFLAVKKWKAFFPTWNDRDFKVSQNSWDELLDHICRAEVYHELCMILSFVPVLFSLFVGKFWIFFLTSIFGAMFDGIFVCMQRYNRPRVLLLLQRQESSTENVQL